MAYNMGETGVYGPIRKYVLERDNRTFVLERDNRIFVLERDNRIFVLYRRGLARSIPGGQDRSKPLYQAAQSKMPAEGLPGSIHTRIKYYDFKVQARR